MLVELELWVISYQVRDYNVDDLSEVYLRTAERLYVLVFRFHHID
jgi:hypothetical protein